jgi:hypothetical protein
LNERNASIFNVDNKPNQRQTRSKKEIDLFGELFVLGPEDGGSQNVGKLPD